MLVLDTSALVKRYVEEEGFETVLELMADDLEWGASALCLPESEVTLCHRGFDDTTLRSLTAALRADWERFAVVPVDDRCLARAAAIGCEQRVRTLDAVHLAAADRLPRPVRFVTFDQRQAEAARVLGLDVL